MQYSHSDVTFIIPSRENLHFLKYAYDSIRRNIGSEPYILCADDYSILDGSKYWMKSIKQTDDRFDYIVNEGPERLGHVILFNSLVDKVQTKLFVLAHADMVWLKGSLDGMLEFMQPKRVVSSTRCEPNFHPPEPCKITLDWLPTDPKDLDEVRLQKYVDDKIANSNIHYTKGIFAPYLMETVEYQSIGGCDSLYRPTSREDDDLWNRLLLNGCEFYQSWTSYNFHRSCAGSRWNPTLTEIGKNSTEWDAHQPKSMRNYIRKFGAVIRHDEWHHPVLFHKYNIGFKVTNCYPHLLNSIEPWCDSVICDLNPVDISKYVKVEQPNTTYCDLNLKINPKGSYKIPDIVIEIDGKTFMQEDMTYLMSISEILTDSGEIGTMKLGNLTLHINALTHYENDLIVVDNTWHGQN